MKSPSLARKLVHVHLCTPALSVYIYMFPPTIMEKDGKGIYDHWKDPCPLQTEDCPLPCSLEEGYITLLCLLKYGCRVCC